MNRNGREEREGGIRGGGGGGGKKKEWGRLVRETDTVYRIPQT